MKKYSRKTKNSAPKKMFSGHHCNQKDISHFSPFGLIKQRDLHECTQEPQNKETYSHGKQHAHRDPEKCHSRKQSILFNFCNTEKLWVFTVMNVNWLMMLLLAQKSQCFCRVDFGETPKVNKIENVLVSMKVATSNKYLNGRKFFSKRKKINK